MKRLFFIALVSLCLNFTNSINAEIRNAYEQQITEVGKCIENIRILLKSELTVVQKEKLEKVLEKHIDKKEHIITMYNKTKELIELLEILAPELYARINNIRNRLGVVTHVYIKVTPFLGNQVYGLTNLEQKLGEPHTYNSIYGSNTLLVQIADMKILKQLYILVHELGHVLYQVPNLASYKEYFDKNYKITKGKRQELGHGHNDPSHKMVIETVGAFRKKFKEVNGKELIAEFKKNDAIKENLLARSIPEVSVDDLR